MKNTVGIKKFEIEQLQREINNCVVHKMITMANSHKIFEHILDIF